MIPQARKLAWVLPLALLLAPTVANAGTVSDVIFRIDATNTVGTGYLDAHADELVYQPATNQWIWSRGLGDITTAGGDIVATLDSATLKLVKDPAATKAYFMELGFALRAGDSNTDFSILSALISFPTLSPGQLQPPLGGGRATASLTLTDVNGNGATLMPAGPPGSGAYKAQYDGWVPNGITFASLLAEMTFGPGGSGTAGSSYPGTGYASINDPVYDMSQMLAFNLTYGDSASGTVTYRILPEPVASLGALVLALTLSWRRR